MFSRLSSVFDLSFFLSFFLFFWYLFLYHHFSIAIARCGLLLNSNPVHSSPKLVSLRKNEVLVAPRLVWIVDRRLCRSGCCPWRWSVLPPGKLLDRRGSSECSSRSSSRFCMSDKFVTAPRARMDARKSSQWVLRTTRSAMEDRGDCCSDVVSG